MGEEVMTEMGAFEILLDDIIVDSINRTKWVDTFNTSQLLSKRTTLVDMHGDLLGTQDALLEALESAVEWRGLDGDGISDPVRAQLYAAIAKARGE